MDLTLENLLKGLENDSMSKQASDDSKECKDHEKAEDKENASAKENLSEAKKAVDAASKDVEDAKKINEKEKEEQTKEAQLAGAALAQEVMSKVASLKQDLNKEPEMNKEASLAGKALAEALLEKLAAAGDVNTENGIAAGSVPQKNIVDSAQMVNEQSAYIQPMQTGNGIRNEGTINQILDAIVADAVAQGATSYGQGVEARAQQADKVEGVREDSAVPNQVDTDETEKAAAVSALVADGLDFASAVELVKSAAEEIEAEENLQIKQAALGALLDRGVDFDDAVAMVKAAGSMIPAAGRALVGPKGKGLSTAAKVAIGAGVGGAVAGGALAAKRSQEKKAALDSLVQSGVDFDQAVGLVNAKAAEIYGE